MANAVLGARVTFARTITAWAALIVVLPGTALAQQSAPAPQAPLAGANAATEAGYGVFQQKCTTCHGNPQYEKAPAPEVLFQYTPERIYDSLTKGVMAGVIGYQLTDAQKRSVSETISGQRLGTAGIADARCPIAARPIHRCSRPRSVRPGMAGA
jgi:mono/diheme cytochrome c family protein